MPRHAGLLWLSIILVALGFLFYGASVGGLFWPKPTPVTDVGLYSVTVMFVGLGLGGLFLRWARLARENVA